MSEPTVAPREWTRLHWVTPVISGGQALLVLFTVVTFQARDALAELQVDTGLWWIIPALAAIVTAFVLGMTALQWRVNMFRISDDAVEQRQGLLFRKQRQARLDRLQAVDVVQPLAARIFGFAEVKVEVAGGKESGVRLRYLKMATAEALRNEILELSHGRKHEGAQAAAGALIEHQTNDAVANLSPFADAKRVGAIQAQAAPEREIFRVRFGSLLGSVVLSWPFVAAIGLPLVLLIVGVAAGPKLFSFTDDPDVIANLTSALLSVAWAFLAVAGVLWAQINAGFNFTAGVSAEGIKLKHGMLDTRRQTVPPGRVQAVKLKQSLLWRRKDWWRITINVAGYQDDQQAVSTLMPVGSRQEALYALWLVLPDMGDPDPRGTVSAALSGKGADSGFTASPARSMIYDLLQWRHRGVRATDRALLIRRGLLVREVFVIPHERTQSLAIRQGPLQRLLRLADIEVHSTNGPVRPVAEHLDVDDALRLIADQAARAREGRARQTPQQWAAAVGIES